MPNFLEQSYCDYERDYLVGCACAVHANAGTLPVEGCPECWARIVGRLRTQCKAQWTEEWHNWTHGR